MSKNYVRADSSTYNVNEINGNVRTLANTVTADGKIAVDIEDITAGGESLAIQSKQDEMIALLEGQTPALNRTKAIPVQIMVGDAGANYDALRANGQDLLVMVDDMNPDVAVNSGLARSLYQTDGSQKAQAWGTDGASQYQLKTDTDGHLQVDVLTAPTTTVTGTITETNSAAILADTASLDTKITQGSDATLSNAQQVLVYGNNSGTLRPFKVGGAGELTTEIDHTWTTATLISLQAVADGASVQGDFDLGNGISHELTSIKFFVTNSAGVNVSVVLQVSPDNSNWYDDAAGSEVAVNNTAFSFTQEDGGAGDGHRYIRCIVTNNDGGATSTNVAVSVGYYA